MMFTSSKVPQHTLTSLEGYVTHRYAPGGFLKAVLSNDLFAAASRTDDENFAALGDICFFIMNNLPRECYGSHEAVENYLNQKDSVS